MNPESFVRGSPTLTTFLFCFVFLVDEGREDPNSSHHPPSREKPLNGISLACRQWPNIECWLGSFVIETIYFCDFFFYTNMLVK